MFELASIMDTSQNFYIKLACVSPPSKLKVKQAQPVVKIARQRIIYP